MQLTTTLDPELYDMPLTLSTRVPANWKTCRIQQGKRTATATPTNGLVRYDALPGADEIVIRAL